MSQNNVFEQVIKLIPRREFERAVAKFDGDKGTSRLDCWSWFGALLFGQLTGHDSIRAIERVFCHSNDRMKRLGFTPIRRSTLAEANHKRPLGLLEEIFKFTLQQARACCPKSHGFRFKGQLLALDSTTISLCLALSPWANYRRQKGGVKLHTSIDLAGDLPELAVITIAKRNDIPVARNNFRFKKGTTVVFDRGYWDSSWLQQLTDSGVFWVTRERRNNQFRVSESRETDRTQGYICDQIVYQKRISGSYSRRYRKRLRRISYKDPDTGKKLTFLTNRFDLATSTICALYKARWKVELFFKTLKQNLKVKKFLGNSAHAVKTQIYVALIAYLLVQMIRAMTKSRVSMPDATAVIGTLLLLRQPLQSLFGRLPCVTRHPPSPQLVLQI